MTNYYKETRKMSWFQKSILFLVNVLNNVLEFNLIIVSFLTLISLNGIIFWSSYEINSDSYILFLFFYPFFGIHILRIIFLQTFGRLVLIPKKWSISSQEKGLIMILEKNEDGEKLIIAFSSEYPIWRFRENNGRDFAVMIIKDPCLFKDRTFKSYGQAEIKDKNNVKTSVKYNLKVCWNFSNLSVHLIVDKISFDRQYWINIEEEITRSLRKQVGDKIKETILNNEVVDIKKIGESLSLLKFEIPFSDCASLKSLVVQEPKRCIEIE